MLSESRYNRELVSQIPSGVAKIRAKALLNYKEQAYPPDILYIRRNERLLDKYIDEREMAHLLKGRDKDLRQNYELFALKKIDQQQLRAKNRIKRSYQNPNDPFLSPPNFDKRAESVYKTQELLNAIQPRNHTQFYTDSKAEVHMKSKKLMLQLCDKEKKFYAVPEIGGKHDDMYKHHDIVRLPERQMIQIANRKNYKIHKPTNGEFENQKLQRIQNDLHQSGDLTAVMKPSDTEDQENETNYDFNLRNGPLILRETDLANESLFCKNFERQRQTPLIVLKQNLNLTSNSGLERNDSETRLKQFTFNGRYQKNTRNRQSSTVMKVNKSIIGPSSTNTSQQTNIRPKLDKLSRSGLRSNAHGILLNGSITTDHIRARNASQIHNSTQGRYVSIQDDNDY